jgi:hypothetical protein
MGRAGMNLQSRVERLERAQIGADEGRVRFIVRVPPKMSREEWQQKCRELGGGGDRLHFTIDLDGAGVFEEGAA